MNDLAGRNILVIGASSGVGRECALAFRRHGAQVAFAARRRAQLDEAVGQAGGGQAIELDAMDPDSIARGVASAADVLGGLDSVFYAAGMSPLASLRAITPEQLSTVFGVNTFGPIHAFAAAMSRSSDDAIFAALSSDSAAQPRHSLVPYAASKCALEAVMEGFRTEELGGRRFVTVMIGPTMPTEFANNFAPEAFGAAIPHWQRQGFRTGIQQANEVGDLLARAFATLFASPSLGMETILLRSPEPLSPLEFDVNAGQPVDD